MEGLFALGLLYVRRAIVACHGAHDRDGGLVEADVASAQRTNLALTHAGVERKNDGHVDGRLVDQIEV